VSLNAVSERCVMRAYLTTGIWTPQLSQIM